MPDEKKYLNSIQAIDNDKELSYSVNNPDHYNQGKIETINIIQDSLSPEAFRGYLKGNVLKYMCRYEYKGMPKKDLLKAEWYLKKLIKEVKN